MADFLKSHVAQLGSHAFEYFPIFDDRRQAYWDRVVDGKGPDEPMVDCRGGVRHLYYDAAKSSGRETEAAVIARQGFDHWPCIDKRRLDLPLNKAVTARSLRFSAGDLLVFAPQHAAPSYVDATGTSAYNQQGVRDLRLSMVRHFAEPQPAIRSRARTVRGDARADPLGHRPRAQYPVDLGQPRVVAQWSVASPGTGILPVL
jgi:hypothetical protein